MISVLLCFITLGFFFFSADTFAARKVGRSGKLSRGRSGSLSGSKAAKTEPKQESVSADKVTEIVPSPEVQIKAKSSLDEDDDIKVPDSFDSFTLNKLRRERDDLKKQVNNLKTQQEMQKKNSKHNSKTAMCSVIGGKSKLIDMQAGVKSQEHKRDRILELVEHASKELKELESWIAENTAKRDEIKAKAEKAGIAKVATGTAAVMAGAGAGMMAMKNADLKSQEAEAKQGPQINTQGLSSGGLSLQNLAGKVDPGKVLEMGKGLLGSGDLGQKVGEAKDKFLGGGKISEIGKILPGGLSGAGELVRGLIPKR